MTYAEVTRSRVRFADAGITLADALKLDGLKNMVESDETRARLVETAAALEECRATHRRTRRRRDHRTSLYE